MPNKLLPGFQLLKFEPKFRDVFNVVHKWLKRNFKYDGYNVVPIHTCLSGNGVTDKSCLVKVIYNSISKTLLYHCKDQKDKKFFYLDLREYRNISGKYRWKHHSFRSWK